MSWRIVVVSRNAKIDYKMNYLVIRSISETKRVHMSEIAVLMMESTAISITAYAMNELIQHKVKVIFCDEKRNPIGEVLPCRGSYDTSSRIRKQTRWAESLKDEVWARIIREKIAGQRSILIKNGLVQEELLKQYLDEIEPGDVTNREGHAAKVYFNALFGMDFSRESDCPVNAALDYGYGIMMSAVNREIAAAGYLTQIGIHHDNVYNAFNLGCDLMEPLRPIVDNAVVDMKPQEFGKAEKQELVSLLNLTVTFDGKRQNLLYAIRLYCQSVFKALDAENPELLQLIGYEL